MANVSYELRQKIISQALKEIEFARNYKQSKTGNWRINEDLYYGRKPKSISSRANVDLGQMASFVHTILSKIDNPLVFKFLKRKDAQVDRVEKLNALRDVDANRDFWDLKDIAGKKQALLYGRAIYSYYADSMNGYEAHLDNVDVYDFLIDPSAGGLDIDRANYIGDYGVILSRDQIKAGIKEKMYLKTEAERLLEGGGNNTEMNQEEVNKKNRTWGTNIAYTEKEMTTTEKFKFWRWGTTYDGKRYYLLLCENAGTAIEVCELEEKFKSGMWWYWSWACFIDQTEFWTPSYCDYVRDLFMAQAVSINQMLDNGEQHTKPMTYVDVEAIENLAELKYRTDGYVRLKGGVDANKAIQVRQAPIIDTPIRVFETLEAIQEKASGVTAAAQGVAENNSGTKATIYEGNQAAVADRFGLLNKAYSFGYKRFATLWKHGVNEHLIKKVAIDILGPNGIEITMVSRRDIFKKDEEFGLAVEASNAELDLSVGDKKLKLDFLRTKGGIQSQQPIQNDKKAYELAADIVGFDKETIRELQSVDEYGTISLMAKADRDIERILDGEVIEPNPAATTAYKQRIVDYMTNNQDALKMEDFNALVMYADSLDQVIARNMTRMANDMLFKQSIQASSAPTPQAPVAGPSGAV